MLRRAFCQDPEHVSAPESRFPGATLGLPSPMLKLFSRKLFIKSGHVFPKHVCRFPAPVSFDISIQTNVSWSHTCLVISVFAADSPESGIPRGRWTGGHGSPGRTGPESSLPETGWGFLPSAFVPVSHEVPC